MAFTVSYIYRVTDRFSGALAKIKRAQDKLNTSLTKGSKRAKEFSRKMECVGGGTQAKVAAAGIGIMAFAASNLEDKMADVSRVTNVVGGDLEGLKGKFQAVGRATGKSALGLADIAFQAGKTGIANDKLVEFSVNVMKTANAFDMVEGEAGRAMGSIRAKMGLTVGGVDVLMNRINFLADNTVADGARMVNILERTSGTMKMFKIPQEVTAGWVAFADQAERSPELAASGLNMMMSRLAKMPGMTAKMLNDPKNAIIDKMKEMSEMSEVSRIGYVEKVFGSEAGRFVNKLVTKIDLLDKSMALAKNKKALSSIEYEWKNYMARTSTKFKRFKEVVVDIFRTIGTQVLRMWDKISPSVIKATEASLKFLQNNPGFVKFGLIATGVAIAVIGIATALGTLFAAVGSVMMAWPLMVAGAGVLAGAVGAISIPVLAVTAAIVGIGAAAYQAYKHFDVLKQSAVDVLEALANVKNQIADTSGQVWSGLKSAPSQIWEGMFGGDDDIVAQNAKATQQTLSGNINVKASQGSEIVSGDLTASHGNVGMNMAGAY